MGSCKLVLLGRADPAAAIAAAGACGARVIDAPRTAAELAGLLSGEIDGALLIGPTDTLTPLEEMLLRLLGNQVAAPGPDLAELLARWTAARAARPLRFMVTEVRKHGDKRLVSGRVMAGRLVAGEPLVFLPSNKTTEVTAITRPGGAEVAQALPGEMVDLMLAEHLFIERGQTAAALADPPNPGNRFRARLAWRGASPPVVGGHYVLSLGAAEHPVELESLEAAGDEPIAVLRSRGMMVLDSYAACPPTGRFLLADERGLAKGELSRGELSRGELPRGELPRGELVAGGTVLEAYRPPVKSGDITQVSHRVTRDQRWQANGHRGGIIWLTGLSGSGKSTIAMEAEGELFRRGYQVFVIDGDNVRHGLNGDLGFSPKDRTENIRRVGEVANLFAEAGVVVITAFISPYIEDRQRARAIAPGHFHEVHVKADLATCEARDPKGLYKKARAGQIPEFTGISAPYEAPETPELVLDTTGVSVAQTVAELIQYIEGRLSLRHEAWRVETA